MSAVTRDGHSLRILNVVDEHTRVAVGCRVARSIGARDVIAELVRLLNGLLEANVVITAWVERYNTERPHRGLGMMTPLQCAARWRAENESRN
jgi:hypothetical protein